MGIRATKLSGIFARFNDVLKDYLENSSIAGSMYYFSPGTRPRERIFWLVAHVACLIYLAFMTVNMTLSFWGTPTVTTEETSRYPIRNISFPGVSICDVNKISYTKAVELAEDILEYKNISNFTHQEVTEMLKYLGHLYVFELNDGEQELLDSLHLLLMDRYGSYVPKLLKRLAPSCQEMMQYCSWAGREEACKDIFSLQLTADGWCCSFNHINRDHQFFENDRNAAAIQAYVSKIKRSLVPRSEFGLTVLVRSNYPDHYYKPLPMMGYEVLINPSLDLPDAPSGGTRKVFVSSGTESLLTLDATPFYSVPEVASYSPVDRRCLFKDELSGKSERAYYSFNDCIAHCRTIMIHTYCDCVPFFYRSLIRARVVPRACDLRDLRCMKKMRAKFMGIRSKADRGIRPNQKFRLYGVDGYMGCVACTFTCADVVYRVSVSSAPLTAPTIWMGKNAYKIDGHSIIKVFFQRPDTVRLKHQLLFDWFDLLSYYGGLCGLFLGVSIISFVEFLYFFTVRLCHKRDDPTDARRNARVIFVEPASPRLPALERNELQFITLP